MFILIASVIAAYFFINKTSIQVVGNDQTFVI